MFFLRWDHAAALRHIGSLNNLSIRSGTGPGHAPVAGVMGDMGWEHMASSLAAACNQGKQSLVSAHASPACSSPAFSLVLMPVLPK